MGKVAPCRIDGLLATSANQAVLFRRGPSRQCQMLVWDFNTDEVIPGQWLKAKVNTKRCDVSPDGRYVVYVAQDYGSARAELSQFKDPDSVWTAVSRPPYFTAIGLWFMVASYHGGGLWPSERILMLNSNAHWRRVLKPPKQIKVGQLGLVSDDEPIFALRLRKNGWMTRRNELTTVKQPRLLKAIIAAYRKEKWWEHLTQERNTTVTGILEKPFACGFLRREKAHNWERWSIHNDAGDEVKAWKPREYHPHFLELDMNGRIVFAENGCLWTWEDFPGGEPKMVADLNPNQFEPIPPPDWAREW